MKITWFGQACFRIEGTTGTTKSGHIAIVTDPFDPKIGLTLPKDLRADVVTVSHQHLDHNYVSAVGGNPTVISTSGTTIVRSSGAKGDGGEGDGIVFTGIDSFHDNKGGKERGKNIIFKFTLEGITCAHLGDLGHILVGGNDGREQEAQRQGQTQEQASEQVRQLQDVDILMIPVGGSYTIDATIAVEVVHQIKPKIIIPMHYGVKGLGFPLDPVELFTEKLALPVRNEDMLEISKEGRIGKGEIVILKLTT